MIGTGVRDDACRDALTAAFASEDAAMDGLAILLFGGNYSTERAFIDRMCSLETFLTRARERLEGRAGLDESVRAALDKVFRFH